MGGIGGVLNLDGSPAKEGDLKRMCLLLDHRGRNGRGFYIHEAAGLLQTSHFDVGSELPLAAIGKRYWITFDGVIYNYKELRSELRKLGYPFRTERDEEVVLAAYIAWGSDSLHKFNGAWAIGILDTEEKKFVLATDRFCIKPLYYYFDSNLFTFSSEIKGFLGIEDLNLEFDSKWKGVETLNAGSTLEISLKTPVPSIKKWWSLEDHLPEISPWPKKQAAHFRELFSEAVSSASKSEIPIGLAIRNSIGSYALAERMDTLPLGLGEILEMPLSKKRKVLSVKIDFMEIVEEMIYFLESTDEINVTSWKAYAALRSGNIRVGIDDIGCNECLGAIPGFMESWKREQEGYEGSFESRGLAQDLQLEWFKSLSFQEWLRKLDYTSRANDVEIRMPFMDWRLVTFCLAIPAKNKIGFKFLREALNLSPAPHEKKLEEEWLRPLIEKVVLLDDFKNTSLFDGRAVEKLVQEEKFREAAAFVKTYILVAKFDQARKRVFSD